MVSAVVEAANGAPLKFVCSTCWLVFDDGGIRACAGCGAAKPPLGWPPMPFEFRARYLFVDQLGRGGQGAVFRAYDRQAASEPWVAVKVAKLQGEALDETFLKEMFRREGRAAAVLSEHPQYFVGFRGSDFNDPAYLVLDFVPWPTLKQMYASEGKLHPLAAARLGIEILRGVRCMERRSMVHRDLKPENIFAHRSTEDLFEVKIADLGVWIDEKASDESLLGRYEDNRLFGTVPYMSPEQVRGDPVTTASDVHAVASILWQLTTGTVPFPTKPTPNMVERAKERLKQCELQPPRPLSMPEELYRILTIALRFDPMERVFADPQTMAGMDNPSNVSVARGMEKALQRFVDEYAERRTLALKAKLKKIQDLELQLAKGEKRIATAQTLSTRAQEFRGRLGRLHGESTGFEVVLEVLRAVELEIHDWDVSVEAFADAGRMQISEAAKRADEAAKRADVEATRAATEAERANTAAKRAAEVEAAAKTNATRADQAESRAAIASRRAEKAEGLLHLAQKQRPTRWLVGLCLALVGSCVGFGLSVFVQSEQSTPSPQQIAAAPGSTETRPLPLVAQTASTAASAAATGPGEPAAAPTQPETSNPTPSTATVASTSSKPADSAAPVTQPLAQKPAAEPQPTTARKPFASTTSTRGIVDSGSIYSPDKPTSKAAPNPSTTAKNRPMIVKPVE
jgi:hypothetical protein